MIVSVLIEACEERVTRVRGEGITSRKEAGGRHWKGYRVDW
jgi:hypothetical protein